MPLRSACAPHCRHFGAAPDVPLPESILRAWLTTDYRVRLARGGYASIRCGEPLPAPLRALLDTADEPWGYITAWNPADVRLPHARNRIRQRGLNTALAAARYRRFGGIGVGQAGWREASLFVPGIAAEPLDAIARRFGQLSVVRGTGACLAELHILV